MCLILHDWDTKLVPPDQIKRTAGYPAFAGKRQCFSCGESQTREEHYDMCYGDVYYMWRKDPE